MDNDASGPVDVDELSDEEQEADTIERIIDSADKGMPSTWTALQLRRAIERVCNEQ